MHGSTILTKQVITKLHKSNFEKLQLILHHMNMKFLAKFRQIRIKSLALIPFERWMHEESSISCYNKYSHSLKKKFNQIEISKVEHVILSP